MALNSTIFSKNPRRGKSQLKFFLTMVLVMEKAKELTTLRLEIIKRVCFKRVRQTCVFVFVLIRDD